MEIHKRLVTDERLRPIAVQIDYEDWLRIERALASQEPIAKSTDLASFSGVLRLEEDPLEFQKRIRKEWS